MLQLHKHNVTVLGGANLCDNSTASLIQQLSKLMCAFCASFIRVALHYFSGRMPQEKFVCGYEKRLEEGNTQRTEASQGNVPIQRSDSMQRNALIQRNTSLELNAPLQRSTSMQRNASLRSNTSRQSDDSLLYYLVDDLFSD